MTKYIYIYIFFFFSTAIKSLIARMNKQVITIGKINISIIKFYRKDQADFNNVCLSKQELLNLS